MTQQEFSRRRQQLLAKMSSHSAAIIFAAPEAPRNGDNEYPYRQNSDFWYLTGFNEPQAALLLIKYDDNNSKQVLFNRVRDLTKEIWYGRRLGQQAALDKLNVDHAFAWEALPEELPELINGFNTLYHALGQYEFADSLIGQVLGILRHGAKQDLNAPDTLIDYRPIVHEMRLFKSDEEIKVMRRAGEISALAHTRAMERCRPGMFEYQLEGEILHEFNRHGARFPSYNTIVGSGGNACILHYTENESELKNGDLVLIDAGCEYKNYAGDISRTFPINGKFTTPQREVYEIVLASMYAAIDLIKPGSSIHLANQAVIRIMVEGLVKLGVMQGDVDTLIEQQAHRQFYMHGLSHWLGLDVHDVGSYGSSLRDREFAAGMVLTVEPGLYIAPYADVPEQYRGIGVRIEDNILVTENGNENLTASVVKTVDEIEALMAKKA